MKERSVPIVRWPAALICGLLATVALMGLMFWARLLFQIRTLPERLMEWLLLFVPPDAFEAGIQRFGPKAKDLALDAGVAVMAALLVVLGTLIARRARSPWPLLAAGPLLYLVAMAVVMPLTGAGPFATGLFQNVWLVNACYLGSALAFSVVLLGGRAVATQPRRDRPTTSFESRRPFLIVLGSLAASYLGVIWFSRQGVTATSTLPLAQVAPPTGAQATPDAAPRPGQALPGQALPGQPLAAPSPVAPALAAQPSPAAEKPASPPVEAALPQPPPPRQIARDQEGSLTTGNRKPGELAAAITPTASHYVVTKNAGGDPVIKPTDWRLILDGALNRPVQLDYRTLRQLPTVELPRTLECISNLTAKCELTPFGCELISTARWKGVRLVDLIELAGGLKGTAAGVLAVTSDEFTSAIAIEVAKDPATLVVYEMNGEVLPYQHGYPARLLVPGRYGFKSPKWLQSLRFTERLELDWYGQRNWNRDGLVKTMTRIDTPAPGAELPPGPLRVAGIAFAGTRGVRMVEVSPDGGRSWTRASAIEPPPADGTWLRWEATVTLPPAASHRLIARATDGSGELQTETFSLPQPDGASGWPEIELKTRPA